ncbi:hypothetical protein LOKVESSMR4R_03923 (plasmid) [Yoonia vestfoldensis]|uniref:Uncharacterized protein n=1 Tax=Yoonia vestfoldensis TaxID=245188 RepID=A0A1Y0EI61_9RHOB|nr:hypothetical protein LOKVESSMR4R_03923 [Yoonia vestfoldensis]
MPRIRAANCVMHAGREGRRVRLVGLCEITDRFARDHWVDDLRNVTVRLPIDREHDLAQKRVFAFRLPEIGNVFLDHLTLSARRDLVDDADHQIAQIICQICAPGCAKATQQGMAHDLRTAAHVPSILAGGAPGQIGDMVWVDTVQEICRKADGTHHL